MTTVNTLIYSSTIDAYVFMCFLIYRWKFISCARTTYHRSKNLNSRSRERVSFLQKSSTVVVLHWRQHIWTRYYIHIHKTNFGIFKGML